MLNYFATLPPSKLILWCYLIWYLVTVTFYFDPAPAIWLNSLGISVIIGFALMLSVTRPAGSPIDYWQTMRLFLMPFCVSSFSALIKGHGFMLILPPQPRQQLVLLGACLGFASCAGLLKLIRKTR